MKMNSTKSKIQESLVGAWTLVEWSEQQSNGPKAFPLGDDAIGQIIYTADGHVAAQLARRGRRSFPSGDWREACDEDAARAFKEYFGYFGTFSINTKKQVITHHIEGSWFPNLEGAVTRSVSFGSRTVSWCSTRTPIGERSGSSGGR
jgi:hypothetical protein